MLTWSIAEEANGTFDYRYIVSGFVSPVLSHVIVELGADCIPNASANCVTSAKAGSSGAAMKPAVFQLGDWCHGVSGNPGVHCQGNSNLGLPKDIIGVEFTSLPGSTTVIVTFHSTRGPAWGDVYLMGGQQYVYDNGLAQHATDANPLDFIARPDPAGGDALSETPEPGGFGVAGAALALIGARIRHIRGASRSRA